MKKSSSIKLLFVTGLLTACTQERAGNEGKNEKKVYMRSDTTASYSRSHGFMAGYFWYHAFRPYGIHSNGSYHRAGYYSDAISSKSNIGRNTYKGKITRGGLGRSGFRASS
ncbi:hypothetical protein [Chryseobacterium potabilaquae]|uniref:Lipoprotein n=1 Tax=Chryseobacterium potabilaquae TaxID=2675057 RepID=A0A6N4X4P3_9FLAO|nr:hypothetical protein [Chryseobacterium potabilaquae]CAA7195037.1 hypothetical protein CHRY9293_01281 [Chryseobacterium potabilaquae]